LRDERTLSHGRIYHMSERIFEGMLNSYRTTLSWTLRHPRLILLVLLATLCLNGYLYVTIPKGFFPQQDTGRITGSIQADQAISFQLMSQKLEQFIAIVKNDPAVDTVVGFTGVGQTNSGFVFLSLKPLAERQLRLTGVIGRLRRELAVVPGATLFLQAVQDIRTGGRQGNAQYQYTLQGNTFADLLEWAPGLRPHSRPSQNSPMSIRINRTRVSKPMS